MKKMIDEKVRVTTLVRAEPERVYDAMTTVEGLNAWFTTSSQVDLRPGGSILFQWKDWGHSKYTGELGGPVLEARRPERFVYKWKVDTDDYLTTVEIDFERVKDGTIVRLVEYSYEDTPTGLKDMLARATGWGEVLTLLKFYVEHGVTY
ncbi:MAG: SRPBCC domain-containing protein [Blastocatellales bacterium]